jgi:hypothetical protein
VGEEKLLGEVLGIRFRLAAAAEKAVNGVPVRAAKLLPRWEGLDGIIATDV